ncbi:amidohydrolase [Conexibacter woesei]|uniref:Amidohydrolase 3 n=1 Tax=Conexibacter woesei (strain DSM 14684 / CCUG 47730 / CIP 108061 / JCM 11494 / NBRC 100937 / ID131577) TaxID=469383 RepID=D3F8N8_CONWI|nr:amidohydrolase family protein [Conexibacter woesei]ADB51002.1 Amidohydrolase 3 [Conexibacter woesei DSM 14684]
MTRSTLLHNGTIRTLAPGGATAPALLIRDGRVAALGERRALAAELGPDGEEVDLGGRTVLPGLVDTHPHLLHFESESDGVVDLTDAADHAEIVARIAAKARTTPPGEWIVTTPVGEPFYFLRRSWRDLPERVLPDRHVLDRATSAHPVFIQAWAPTEPNVCAFNSAGLARLGIADPAPDRVGDVWIDKDHAGGVTGLLRGAVNEIYSHDPYWQQLLDRIPHAAPDLLVTTRRAVAQANARGVTTVYEPHEMTAEHVGVYRRLRDLGQLDVRVTLALEVDQSRALDDLGGTLAGLRDGLAQTRALRDTADERVRVTGATLSYAGELSYELYRDVYGRMTKGRARFHRDVTRAFADGCLEHDLRANFLSSDFVHHDHVLGILEAPELAARVRDRGWILQHAPLIGELHAQRFQALGFDVTTSTGFAWGLGAAYGEKWGRQVWRDLVPLKRLLLAGLTVAGGSDWGPRSPFEQLWLAETHEIAGTGGHRNAGADQVVTRAEALAMWTSAAAEVLRWPEVGTLAVGAWGDAIVLDRDPLTCPLDDLPGTTVELTLAGGRVVHDSGAVARG